MIKFIYVLFYHINIGYENPILKIYFKMLYNGIAVEQINEQMIFQSLWKVNS